VAAILAAPQGYPSTVSTNAGFDERDDVKSDNHTFNLTYQLNPNNRLKYIGSQRKQNQSDQVDLDSTPAFVYQYATVSSFKVQSNELQWVGDSGDLKYVAGYYDYKEEFKTYNPQSSSGTTNFANDVSGTTKANAIFAQLDYKFSEHWSGSAGIRRSKDKKSADSSQYGTSTMFNGAMTSAGLAAFINTGRLVPVTTSLGDVLLAGLPLDLSRQPTGATTVSFPSAFHAASSATFSSTTPALSLTYKHDERLSIYGRVAAGFRAGGFPSTAGGASTAQVIAARTTPFNPEKSETRELGFKSAFWNGKGQLSGSIYENVINDQQTNQLVPGTTSTITVNAGKTKYHGLELEGNFLVAEGWRVGASWGHIDAKYERYMDNGANNGGILIDTASNRVVPYAPKNTLNLNVDGILGRTAWGTLRGVLDINHTDEMYNLAANKNPAAANAARVTTAANATIPARTIVNGRLTLAGLPVGGPGRADLSFWVRNLTDTRKMINNIDFGTYRTVLWTDPRMYGLSFGYKW